MVLGALKNFLGGADLGYIEEDTLDVEGNFGAIPANYIGLEALIRAKEAADRPQDRADVKVLRRVQGDEG